MSVDRPDVIPSPVDPDYECVRIEAAAGGLPPAAPPPGGEPEAPGPRLCPEGYVPRRRRRPRYELEGKRIRPDPPAREQPKSTDDEA